MPMLTQHSAPRLYSASGTNYEANIVASARGVLLDITSKNYDTMGYRRRSSAVANLTVAQARHLSGLLNEAISAASAEPSDTRQTAKWSDATLRAVGEGFAA